MMSSSDEESVIPWATARIIPLEVDKLEPQPQQQQQRRSRLVILFVFLVVVVLVLISYIAISSTQDSDEDSANDGWPIDDPPESVTPGPCGVAPYQRLFAPAECNDLKVGHTNYYWGNDNFFCRLNKRPCNSETSLYQLDLGRYGKLDLDTSVSDYGAAEVWMVSANKSGQIKDNGFLWDLCFGFRAEGEVEYSEVPGRPPIGDVNDYEFGSLACCGGQDEDDRFYIIIDGVLVDSCPKSISEGCHSCDEFETQDHSQEMEACNVAPYERLDNPAECKDLKIGHTNYYWPNDNFLCRLNERPCDSHASRYQLDLGSNGKLDLDIPESEYDYGVAEVWEVSADGNGLKDNAFPWNFCYGFLSEGTFEYSEIPEEPPRGDVNDYKFGSLQCCGSQDEDDRLYLIIDGVLVDSCPKSVSEACRNCSQVESLYPP